MRYYKTAQTSNRWTFRLLIVALLVCIALLAPSLRERLLMLPSANNLTFAAANHYQQPRLQHMPLPAAPVLEPSAEIAPTQPPQVEPTPQHVIVDDPPVMDMPRELGLGAAFADPNGILPEGTSVFNDDYPGVTKLNPALLAALREAAKSASDNAVDFYVTSGWRSPAYQEQLLREAIIEYGSQEEALRWVATAETSSHVSGDAVDIGQYNAIDWLAQHGAEYGLCQIYANEPWHYELRPEAREQGCPQMYSDPSHDPRMQP